MPANQTGTRRTSSAVPVAYSLVIGMDDKESVPSQPADSRIVCRAAVDGITLTVPPAGIWRGSAGLLPIGLIWLVFFGALFALIQSENPAPLGWDAIIFLPLFPLIGIGLVLAGINVARRRAVLAVVGDRLLVLQTDLFGSKRREWDRADLQAVQMGPSGAEMNDQPIMELQVCSQDGKHFGMLVGRDEAELEWLAGVLRRSLRLDAVATDPDESEEADDS